MNYKSRLNAYVDRAFEALPQSEAVQNTKAELVADLENRYDDALADGQTPESAYNTAIGSIGDVFEIVDSLDTRKKKGSTKNTPGQNSIQEIKQSGDSGNTHWHKVRLLLPYFAAGTLVLFLLADLISPPGPKSVLRHAPLFFIVAGAVILLGLFGASRKNGWGFEPNGAKWYPVFVGVLWVLAAMLCLFALATPHLRRLVWFILLVALAVQGIVRSVLSIHREGEDIG